MNSVVMWPVKAGSRMVATAAGLALSAASLLSPVSLAQDAGLPDVSCVIMPSLMVDVASSVPGVLSAVNVDRGHIVKRGQIVATLDSGVEQAELALAKARAGIVSEVKLNEVNLSYDERTRDRLSSLEKGEMASKQEQDRAARNAALSKWRVKQAKDISELRTLERARSEEILKRKSISSPISGVVVTRYRTKGEYVKEQPILRVVQLNPLHVEAAVPMEYYGDVTVGMRASIRSHSDTAQAYNSTVEVVDSVGDPTTNSFGVRLSLPNENLSIAAGNKCNLSFIAE